MIVGTRESKLAMRQTEIFVESMRKTHPGIACEIVGMKVSGDIDQTSPLSELQGFGAFVRELDSALLAGKIDVSVNSMKDMPIEYPEGITVPAILPRAAVEDVMIPCGIDDLKLGAVVGTSSIRRAASIKVLRPDLNTMPLRGNIHTRLSKLDDGRYDAIVLAKAGLDRMGINRKMTALNVDDFIPAPAQGAIAISCRSDDPCTIGILKKLDCASTRAEVEAERTIMRLMNAGCSSPIGINAEINGSNIRMRAISFEYSEIPIKIDRLIPAEYTTDDLKSIANTLMGCDQ